VCEAVTNSLQALGMSCCIPRSFCHWLRWQDSYSIPTSVLLTSKLASQFCGDDLAYPLGIVEKYFETVCY